jgi:hypothetical protein
VGPEPITQARQFERLANTAVDLGTLPDQLLQGLARVVPFDSYCWGAIDPRSVLPTSGIGTTVPLASPLLWEVQEIVARNLEPGGIRSLARSGRPVALLSEIVGGHKDQSSIYRLILRPNGLEHQLRSALALDGVHWGQLHIERRPDRPDFSSSEVALVEALVPHLAHAFRRWLIAEPGATGSANPPAVPGVIVLDEDNEVDSISAEAEHWPANGDCPTSSAPPLQSAGLSAPRAPEPTAARTRFRAHVCG